MRHPLAALTLFLTLLAAAACQQEKAETQATPASVAQAEAEHTLTPEELGTLGAQIKKEPDRADDILAQKGLNRETFEDAVREVTENAEASKRYTDAYRKAGA